MKSYNSSKFTNALIRKETKDLCSSQREKNLRKVGLCFITGCFIKSFESSFAAQLLLFDIRMTQEISKGEVGNDKWLAVENYNIYFKNNFNRLVMNIT